MQIHSLNVKVAEVVGVNKALLLQYIEFWVEKNRANDVGIYEGKAWVYHTANGFAQIFPYMKPNTICKYLIELENDGYIVSMKNPDKSKNRNNQTKFYTLTQKYFEIMASKNQNEFAKNQNEFAKNQNEFAKNQNLYNDFSELENNISSLYGRINIFCSYVEKETDLNKLASVFANVLDKENMHFIETYSCSQPYEPAATEAVYSKIFLPSDLKKTYISFRRYYKFKIKDKICYVNRKIIDKNKENPLEEFGKKGLTINLKTNPISKKSICPEDKLVLDKKNINKFKQNLRKKLSKKHVYLMQFVMPADGSEDYNIYNESKYFYVLLSQYLKRTISKHPLEWDFAKIKEDRVCESR